MLFHSMKRSARPARESISPAEEASAYRVRIPGRAFSILNVLAEGRSGLGVANCPGEFASTRVLPIGASRSWGGVVTASARTARASRLTEPMPAQTRRVQLPRYARDSIT